MAIVSAIMAITLAFTSFKNGKVIMIVTLKVKKFTEWKKMFGVDASVHEKAGIKVLSVCSLVGNENHVVVIEEAENVRAAQNFLSILKSIQKDGDMNRLDVKMYNKTE